MKIWKSLALSLSLTLASFVASDARAADDSLGSCANDASRVYVEVVDKGNITELHVTTGRAKTRVYEVLTSYSSMDVANGGHLTAAKGGHMSGIGYGFHSAAILLVHRDKDGSVLATLSERGFVWPNLICDL